MAINFPSNPTLGQQYVFGDIVWQFDGNGWVNVGDSAEIGPPGAAGAQGPGAGLMYQYDSVTAGDPDTGHFRFNANLSSPPNAVSFHKIDYNGLSAASFLAAIDLNNAFTVFITDNPQGSRYMTFHCTSAFSDDGNYMTASISGIVSKGSFVDNGGPFYVWFEASGAAGAAGSNGTNGFDGAEGQRGASLFTDNGEPHDYMGENGDFYIDRITSNLYEKQSNLWVLTSSLVSAALPVAPQGRLTLTSGVAVTETDVTGATTVYFTNAIGNKIPLWNGSQWVVRTFTELSNITTNSATGKAGPAAVGNNAIHFLMLWDDNGQTRLTRSPAWTSDTVVGTGAGSAEIDFRDGVPINKFDITNGPLAGYGLIIGAVRSNGSAQLTDSFARRWVSNIYNAVPRAMRVLETGSWNYTTDSWRQANANTANQCDWLHALAGVMTEAEVHAAVSNTSAGVYVLVAIGIDNNTAATTGFLTAYNDTQVASKNIGLDASWKGFAGQGRHYAAWLERSQAVGTSTWIGDGGAPSLIQMGTHGWTLN